ncbi:MAG: DNA polymerase III subunit alpha [Tannerellaceae bacterium]
MNPFVHLHVHSQYSLLDGQASISGLVDKAIADGMTAIALTDHGTMFGIKEFYNYVKKKNSKYQSTISDCEKELNELKEKEHLTDEEQERFDKLQAKIKESKAALFKPILGCECYVAPDHRTNKGGREHRSGNHLVVLAKNKQGYKNLIKIVSYSWTEGFYGRPRIDKELLEKYKEGLIISSACLGGEVSRLIMKGNIAQAEEVVLWYKKTFGDDYYLELQRHKTSAPDADRTIYPKQEEVNAVLIELARKHNIKLIATNDVHFVNDVDAEAHDRLICLNTGSDFDDPNRMRYTKQEWLKTRAEIAQLFADVPEVMTNTQEIASKVEFYSIDSKPLMPDFPIPDGFGDSDDYLRYLSYRGAIKKYQHRVPETFFEGGDAATMAENPTKEEVEQFRENLDEEVRERIDFELETVKKMGFPGYFLIVQDFIAAARKMGVAVGPGRGSAAGSAVAFCLGITDIDPIKYDLLFERFLNPDRISMPDIDIDFDDDGRGDVLRWVTEKYGKERVAHIITYGTMATKSAIKDVARVQRLPLSESNRLAKLVPDKIPDKKKVTLRDAIAYVPELKEAAESRDPVMRDTLKYAQMLEGNVRNTGVHACGVIIGKEDISNVVPVSTAKDKETDQDLLVTQFEGSVIEETGLIKMDFLGLKTLSIIKEAVENVKQTTGETIDVNTISLEDPKTYELYSNGKTTGTFQFESAGMQKYLRELQPSTFEDLIAMNALYRPGPMEYIPSFIARKHGEEEIKYDIPIMERYLKDTYGITVYQEQVMLLSRLLANFTRGQSDELRKAMGKKMIDKMNALKVKFLDGAKANGHDEKTLNKIWADWEKFASYAFNKSHATCYSWVAYQTAYLKANYPSEYMAAVLSRNISNIADITKFMDECKAMSIQVLGPDVNESGLKFSVNKAGDIRFGLGAIKGVGEGAVQNILEERRKNGPFKGLFDFVERVNLNACNKKNIEALAIAGAFDNFPEAKREQFFGENTKGETFLEVLVRYGNKFQIDKNSASNSLFGDDDFVAIARPDVPMAESWSDLERLSREKELVGIYLSAHPLDEYKIVLTNVCNTQMIELADRDALRGKEMLLGGIVDSFREGMTKMGKPYGVVKLEDYSGSAEIALFGNDYIEYAKYCKPGLYLLINATVQPRRFKENELDFKIGAIRLLPDVKDQLIEKIKIMVSMHALDDTMINELATLIKQKPGSTLLYFTVIDGERNIKLDFFAQNNRISVGKELIEYIRENENLDFKIN